MSALLPEDSFEETEILFTAVPQSNPEQMPANTEKLPGHVEFLKNKLKDQQLRKKRLSEADTGKSPSTESTKNSRARLWKKMMARTESLNADAEKFNTQSAVLLSALQKLQSSIEDSRNDNEQLVSNFKDLNSECEDLKQQLEVGLDDVRNQSTAAAKNNETSSELIQRIESLLEDTETNHSTSQQQAESTLSILEKAQHHQALFTASAESFSQLRSEADDYVAEAKNVSDEAKEQSETLKELISRNQATTEHLESLSQEILDTKGELISERDTQRTLNEQVRSRISHTEKLNQQQSTLIELTESRSDELKEELNNTLRQNKKYQMRLQQTEEKLKEAIQVQESYKLDYEKSRELLKRNESLLQRAANSLKETESHSAQFNNSLAQFHHANEQSQHMAMRTQNTLDKIIARNEYLEKENRALSERLSSNISVDTPPITRPHIQGKNTNLSNQQAEDVILNETPSFTDLNLEAKSGFYRLMMVLAIILPLSFIAHSVISTFANPANAVSEQSLSGELHTLPNDNLSSAFVPASSN